MLIDKQFSRNPASRHKNGHDRAMRMDQMFYTLTTLYKHVMITSTNNGCSLSVTSPCASPHPHKDELFTTRIVVLVAVFPLLVDVNMFRLYNYIILNAHCVCVGVCVCVGGEGGGGNPNLQY